MVPVNLLESPSDSVCSQRSSEYESKDFFLAGTNFSLVHLMIVGGFAAFDRGFADLGQRIGRIDFIVTTGPERSPVRSVGGTLIFSIENCAPHQGLLKNALAKVFSDGGDSFVPWA